MYLNRIYGIFIAYCINGFVHLMGWTTDDVLYTSSIFLHKQQLFLEFWFMLSFQCVRRILNKLIVNVKLTEFRVTLKKLLIWLYIRCDHLVRLAISFYFICLPPFCKHIYIYIMNIGTSRSWNILNKIIFVNMDFKIKVHEKWNKNFRGGVK